MRHKRRHTLQSLLIGQGFINSSADRLSSCNLHALQIEPQKYPLYLAEWVEELLSRIFAILHNLDSPETRTESAAAADAASTHSQSFLLHSESMFRYDCCLALFDAECTKAKHGPATMPRSGAF